MRDPVILINYANDHLSIPITSKPLPALLAPPTGFADGSLSSFASSVSNLERSNSSLSLMEEQHSYLQNNDNRNYYNVIQRQSQEIQDLRQDLIKLNQKYIDQVERIKTAEQAQFLVESELEDLSTKLFEQANEMVAQEKKARFYAEKKVSQLERELKKVYEELDNEKAQLKELKEKLTQEESSPLSIHPLSMTENNSSNNDEFQYTATIESNNVYLDNGWLSLFKDFLTLAPNTPIESIHRLPFLKHCLDLDIEPCLRFGNRWCKLSMKIIVYSLIKQPCFIESDTPRKRHSHDNALPNKPITRRSSFAIFNTTKKTDESIQCYGCNNNVNTLTDLFRFKLKETDTEWFWIDRSCRDRLVAVCDFYVFIRHVRQGLQSQRTINSLFQECVWLRLVMFWARSGVHHSLQK